MIKIAHFMTLEEWDKLGYKLKANIKKPFAWTVSTNIPLYESAQVEKK